MMIPLLNIPKLHSPFQTEIEESFRELLLTGQFINGPQIEEFEKKVIEFTGSKFALATGSGTDSLMLTLMALGVKSGDEVITTPYTFFSTAGSIARLGAVPVFVDIENSTFNIDPKLIDAAITDKTVGIIPVHLFGNCADMTSIQKIAAEKSLFIIEDAAQAIGAKQNGKFAGNMGDAAIFSFFPAKNLGALGDAGGVVTNNSKLYKKMLALRSHGAEKKYHHKYIGGNFRMDSLQAAMLNIKFKFLDEWTNKRRSVAGYYNTQFAGIKELVTPELENDFHVYNQYVIRVPANRRSSIIELFKKREIGFGIYYPAPLHLQPCFDYLGYKRGSLPKAEIACLENLALPIDPNISPDEMKLVAETVKEGMNI
ncbi:MAG: DegT/DnrJ/EryC1/StrS family aminotransferase [Deltaproteobacteria bacterium]|nr:DegT/DnrJ/EryC1/StrS family aminotransferase [Deltaproteobacteria bacterium]